MLSCEEACRLLGRSIDATLTPEAARRLQRHLHDCPACAAEAEAQLDVKRLLASRTDVEVPAAFAGRLRLWLDEEGANWIERGNWSRWGTWLMPAAAALVLAAFVAESNHQPNTAATTDLQMVVSSWGTEQGGVTALLAEPDTDESLMEALVAVPASTEGERQR